MPRLLAAPDILNGRDQSGFNVFRFFRSSTVHCCDVWWRGRWQVGGAGGAMLVELVVCVVALVVVMLIW